MLKPKITISAPEIKKNNQKQISNSNFSVAIVAWHFSFFEF